MPYHFDIACNKSILKCCVGGRTFKGYFDLTPVRQYRSGADGKIEAGVKLDMIQLYKFNRRFAPAAAPMQRMVVQPQTARGVAQQV